MKNILFASVLSLAMTISGLSASSTELNGALKSGMKITDLRVVVTGDGKADKLVPIPERNSLRVAPVPPLPERKPKRETFNFDGMKRADGSRGTLTFKDRCALPHAFGYGKLPPECYPSWPSWEI